MRMLKVDSSKLKVMSRLTHPHVIQSARTPKRLIGIPEIARIGAARVPVREIRGGTTTFVRQREGRWCHKKYAGWISWDETQGGVLVAEVRTREEDNEWQLLQSFIGYL